jgi:hypothetical protein
MKMSCSLQLLGVVRTNDFLEGTMKMMRTMMKLVEGQSQMASWAGCQVG